MRSTGSQKVPGKITRLIQLSLSRRHHAELASVAGEQGKSVDAVVSDLVVEMLEWRKWQPDPSLLARIEGGMDDDIPF